MAKSTTYCREGCDVYEAWLRHEDTVEKLQSKLATAEQSIKDLGAACQRHKATADELNEQLTAAEEQNKWLREKHQKIVVLYNRDKERGTFASSQDFQCGVRKGKKEAAEIAEQALKEKP